MTTLVADLEGMLIKLLKLTMLSSPTQYRYVSELNIYHLSYYQS